MRLSILLILFLEFLVHLQEVDGVGYHVLRLLDYGEVDDAHLDVGHLFPHLANLFPFEHTQLIDEYVTLVVECGQFVVVVLFDNLFAFFQEMKRISNLLDIIETNSKPLLNGESYLTDTELAQCLKLTKRTLQEYRNTGRIPFYLVGGKILYREADIERLLSDNRREAFK